MGPERVLGLRLRNGEELCCYPSLSTQGKLRPLSDGQDTILVESEQEKAGMGNEMGTTEIEGTD